jgi:arabinan endo-1,5-alpha-L-arabinosidase
VQNGKYYGIVSKCSEGNSGLDVFDWSTENGGNVNQWEYWGGDCQLWKLTPVYPKVSSGTYTVRNVNSGLFIAEKSSNAVQSDSQPLTFTQLNDGTYTIENSNGDFLTVEGNSSENDTNVKFAEYTGDDSQKFTLTPNKDGSYSILTVSSSGNSCVDVFGISTDDGANLCQWEYWGGSGQKFVLEPTTTPEESTEPTTTTEPTQTTEPPTTTEEQPIHGDSDPDKVYTYTDLMRLKKYILGISKSIDFTTSDLNLDNNVNILDVVILKNILLES